MKCEYIRKLIDETDRPDRLPVEVSGHIESCNECRLFADERAGLRGLLAAATVTAPSNFEAVLSQKLASRLSPQTSDRLIPARYAWIGAAVAAVILMVFAVFQSGIYKNQPGGKQLSSESVNSLPGVVTTQPTNGDKSPQKGESRGSSTLIAETKPHDYQAKPSGASQRISLRPKSPRISNSIGDTAAVILLRENSREFQVSIPTISVGAQPIAYVSQVSEVSHGTQIAY